MKTYSPGTSSGLQTMLRHCFMTLTLLFVASPVFSQSSKTTVLSEALNNASHDTVRAMRHYDLSAHYLESGDSVSAMHHARAGFMLSEKSAYHVGLAMGYNRIGAVLLHQDHYDEAIRHFNTAAELAKLHNCGPASALASFNLGQAYCFLGQHEAALSNLHDAIGRYRQLNDRTALGKCYYARSVVHTDEEKLMRATQEAKSALKIFRRTKDTRDEAIVLCHLGFLSYKTFRNNRGMRLLSRAEKIASGLGDRRMLASCYGTRANIHTVKKQYDDASKYYMDAMKVYEDYGDKINVAALLGNLGATYKRMGRDAEADTCFGKGLLLAQAISARDVEMNIRRQMEDEQ